MALTTTSPGRSATTDRGPAAHPPGRRAPWAVLLLGLLFVVDALLIGADAGDRLRGGGTDDPSAESTLAAELLREHFPAAQPNLVLLVSGTESRGVNDRDVAAQGGELAARLAFEPSVTGVLSYWQTGAGQLRSEDGGQALILAHVRGDEDAAKAVFRRLVPDYRGSPADLPALSVQLGGPVAVLEELQSTIAADLLTAELIAVPLTLIILVVVFGGLVAALLPLGVGIVAVLGTKAVLRVLTEFAEVSVFAQNLTTALGLGLAIDYALLIVRRYREELATGADPHTAVGSTVRTAGRTVLFSALTIMTALSAMLVFPLYFLRSFAYAGISVVALAAGAALLLLPAALRLLGHRVDALRVLRRRAPAGAGGGAGWRRLVTWAVRRAPLVTVAVAGALLLAGLPFARIAFGAADDRQLPQGAEARTVQDTLREDFPDTTTGTVEVLARQADPDTPGDAAALRGYAAALSELPAVERVDTPLGGYRNGALDAAATPADAVRGGAGMSHLTLTPVAGVEATDETAQRLVRQVRDLTAADPAHRALSPVVGGQSAQLVDSKAAIGSRLGWAALVIVAASLLLMFLLTGSVVIPLQAVLLNALSLSAMFGVVVWVFQDGHLSSLLGFTATGTVETTLPVLMFCVAFGLSMDYTVFVLARMTEEHRRHGDSTRAVVAGVQRTGGIITAAALILSVVLIAIGTSQITNTKMLGLGVALAVLVDATVVRALLLPAVMRLCGPATWWAPAPLRRFQRRFGLREEPETAREETP
ncbi:MMPL family transporter [Streptomyces xiamenensis]|uniref:MMPL family transporter n=1 Tax=Streptomyces xiamenensis TaxID=408015 RepID=UPI0035D9C5E6